MNSPESQIYTKGHTLFGLHQARHAIRQAEEAILVEGNFDVVSLHARGIRNVVAPLGTAFTDEQAKLLKRFAPNVVLAFDGDAAGKKATKASRAALRAAGITARVMRMPQGKDPDEIVRARGRKGFEEMLAASKGMLEYMIDAALDEGFQSASAVEKSQRVQEVAELLRSEDDVLVRSMAKAYADELAGRLDLVSSQDAFRALEASVKRALAEARARGEVVLPSDARVKTRSPGSEERKAIAEALIECPDLLSDTEIQAELGVLEGPGVQVVFALRKAWDFELRKLDVSAFLEALPRELKSFAERVLAKPSLFDEKEAKEYLLDNAKKLKRLLLAQSTSELARENYRTEGEEEEQAERAREAVERMREKHGVK